MKIVLSGNPISTNSLYRVHGHILYLTKKAKELKLSYQWEAKSQWRKPPIGKELEIHIELYFKNKIWRDWDNYHKLSMDALNGIVWRDDRQIKKATVEKFIDTKNPRIEIELI